MFKWAAALLGYYFFRFPGAIFGYFTGALIEQYNKRSFYNNINPADFEINLLALASTVIKADGSVKKQELEFVRNFFIGNYGQDKAKKIFKIFNEQVKNEIQNIENLSKVFIDRTRYETRLQIIHFLYGVANSDGKIANQELDKINQIAIALGIKLLDVESIKAMFVKSSDNAYKILEIEPNASDEEVKTAYRNMAKKYHPDRIYSKDPAMIKGAKEKFQEVQKAYEIIQKERGI